MPQDFLLESKKTNELTVQNILVTGASGFIASRVASLLLERGDNVIGVDNMNDAYDVRLKWHRLEALRQNPRMTFHQMDICDREAMEEAVFSRHRIDAVINLAARAGVRQSVEQPDLYFETNLRGTLELLELCNKYQVPKLILSSTSSVYGDQTSMPFTEALQTSRPLSPYAASKKAAEQLCYTYHYLYGIDITVFRYFTVYGPAGRPDMSLFRFTQWISEGLPLLVYGDGKQSRDFTHVDDIARGTIAGLRPLGYEIINLGSDRPVVLNDAIAKIQEAVGKEAILTYQQRHSADVLATWADVSKADRLLDWRPATSFGQGIEGLVRWYVDNRELAAAIETGVPKVRASTPD